MPDDVPLLQDKQKVCRQISRLAAQIDEGQGQCVDPLGKFPLEFRGTSLDSSCSREGPSEPLGLRQA